MEPRSIHFSLSHVHAACTRPAVASVSAYIRDAGLWDVDAGPSVEAAMAYIKATGRHRESAARVAATAFFCRGSHESSKIWRQLDNSFRTKSGEYSRRGGNNRRRGDQRRSSGKARLAVFADGTLPRELTEKQKLAVGTDMAKALVARYGCCVEVAWHIKDGVIDHLHLLISTRSVDEGGVGEIIRDFNGIASKCASETDRVAGHAEFCRTTFATLLTDATGILYDARSFRRQGRSDEPVPWVPRDRIEHEARLGVDDWIRERRDMLARRAGQPIISADSASPSPSSTSVAGIRIQILRAVEASSLPVYRPHHSIFAGHDHRCLENVRDEETRRKIARQDQDWELRADYAAFAAEQQHKVAALTRLAEATTSLPGQLPRAPENAGITKVANGFEREPLRKPATPKPINDPKRPLDTRETTSPQVVPHAVQEEDDENKSTEKKKREEQAVAIVAAFERSALATCQEPTAASIQRTERLPSRGQTITNRMTPGPTPPRVDSASSSSSIREKRKSPGSSFTNRVEVFSEGYEDGIVDRAWNQGPKIDRITEPRKEGTPSQIKPVSETPATLHKDIAADTTTRQPLRQPSTATEHSRDLKTETKGIRPPAASLAERPEHTSDSEDVATRRKDASFPKGVSQNDLRVACVSVGAFHLLTRKIYYQEEELARIAGLLAAEYEEEVKRFVNAFRKLEIKALRLNIEAVVRNTEHPELIRLIGKSGKPGSEAPPVDQRQQQDRPYPARNKTKTGQGL